MGDVHRANNNGATPLFMSCQEGHLDIVRFLLSEDVAADVQQADRNGQTALDVAAYLNHLSIVRALCQAGASSANALTYAQQQGHGAIVAYLTSHRQDVRWCSLRVR